MKFLFAAVLIAGTVAGLGAASAEGGCGPGWHRNPYGECRPNRGPVIVERPVVVAPGVVVETPAVRRCPVGFAWRYGACRPI